MVTRITGYDPIDDMLKVKSIQQKLRDSFAGPLAEKWDVTSFGDTTATTSGGELTIASGVQPGAFVEITSQMFFTIPFRMMAGVLNTRHASNHHVIEIVSCDPRTGQVDNKHGIQVDIGGAASATATQMKYGVWHGGLRPLESGASTIATTASYSVIELEPFSDEAYFHSRTIDTTAGRANSYVRHQQIPDPNAYYKLRIRSMNHAAYKTVTGAVAGPGGAIRLTIAAHAYPAGTVWVEHMHGVTDNGAELRGNYAFTVVDANTIELTGTTFAGEYAIGTGRAALAAAPTAVNMKFQFINAMDYAELTAEITAGRGQVVEGQAIGAKIVGTAVVSVSGTPNVASQDNMYWNDSTTNQAASATLTGTARDTGIAAGAVQRYSYFKAFAYSSHAGTMRIECSNDNVTWRRATPDTAVAADSPTVVQVPVLTRYHRAVYVNGATLTTAFMLNTGFTAA